MVLDRTADNATLVNKNDGTFRINHSGNSTDAHLVIATNGNVSIGTTTATAQLTIATPALGNNLNDVVEMQRLYGNNANVNNLDIRHIRTAAGASWFTAGTRIQEKIDATWMGYLQFNGNSNDGGISFGTGQTTTAPGNVTEQMRITGAGNVGIGTASPAAKLDILGAIKIVDGAQGAGKVLTSDAAGLASWQTQSGGGIAPIGSIQAWVKSMPGTPALPTGWVECNGAVLADAGSPYNGQTIPNLNGGNRFLQGNATSGATGGSATHTHTFSQTATDLAPDASNVANGSYTDAANHLPPYFNVVWIMRVK